MIIREASLDDFDAIWQIFEPIARAGETYAYDRAVTKEKAKHIWMQLPRKTFVACEGDKVLGTYYIKSNQDGGGKHVCNCGYMVSPDARGKGLATKMCEHSQEVAKALGYKAMQFNFVISTNTTAIELWKRLGFSHVGTLPHAFEHPKEGFVDALVMYKWLEEN